MVKMISCPVWKGLGKAFLIGHSQVTQELWESVMGANPSSQKGAHLPVHDVSWFDCVYFCNKLSGLEGLSPAYEVRSSYDEIGNEYEPEVTLNKEANGYRLPTEAEWEYAAKAGGEFKYSGSDTLDEVAWYEGNSGFETHPVGQKQANGWGLYDMTGNVWEWCSDEWSDDYSAHKQGVSDPLNGRPGAALRVNRGGSWDGGAVSCRVAYRYRYTPDYRSRILGLRLSRSID